MGTLRSLAEATDISLLQEIFDAFLGDSAMRLQSLRDALRAGDAQVLKQAAHALSGSSANIGARQMARLSHELEVLGAPGQGGSLESAARLINQLEEEFARVQSELRAELEKLAP